MKSGFKTSEFWRGILLYCLAGYMIWSGHTPDELNGAISVLQDQLNANIKTLSTIVALVVPLIDNMHYTHKRTELKKK